MIVNKKLHNPYNIVKQFEEAIADYTGAPYAVAVDNCTNALFLALKYTWGDDVGPKEVIIPKQTYLSVPQAIIHAGGIPVFRDIEWSGVYPLKFTHVWDSAKRLTSNMYIHKSYMCLSFHIKKTLSIGKGGMILTDNEDAVKWFKQARYEGRNEIEYHRDDITMLGWNMYMTPQQAAHGLALLQNYPDEVPDLGENYGYRDLTEFTIFKELAEQGKCIIE